MSKIVSYDKQSLNQSPNFFLQTKHTHTNTLAMANHTESSLLEDNTNKSNNTNDKFQSVVRRKLERFRTKLSELLFTVNDNSLHNNNNTNINNQNQFTSIVHSPNTQQQHQAQALSDDNNSMLISNYYYGYTSPISEEDLRYGYKNNSKRSKKFHKITSSSSSSNSSSSGSSSACSSSSSMIIDDDDSHSNLSSYHSQPQNGNLTYNKHPIFIHNSEVY